MEQTSQIVPDAIQGSNESLTLLDLPDEILREILSHLPRDGRLRHVSLTSWRCKRIAEEFLYNTVKAYPDRAREYYSERSGGKCDSHTAICNLVYHFTANPDYGYVFDFFLT